MSPDTILVLILLVTFQYIVMFSNVECVQISLFKDILWI